jgi:hypothetical protein
MKKTTGLFLALLSAPASAVTQVDLAYCDLVKSVASVQILNRMTGASFDDAEEWINERFWDHSFYKMAYKITVDAYETEIERSKDGLLSQSKKYPQNWYNTCILAMEANG